MSTPTSPLFACPLLSSPPLPHLPPAAIAAETFCPPSDSGKVILDHVEPESGGYTGLAIQRDPVTNRPAFYAATITGGLYVLRLEAETVEEGGQGMREGRGRGEKQGRARGVGAGRGRLALRCMGFVQGTPIL